MLFLVSFQAVHNFIWRPTRKPLRVTRHVTYVRKAFVHLPRTKLTFTSRVPTHIQHNSIFKIGLHLQAHFQAINLCYNSQNTQ